MEQNSLKAVYQLVVHCCEFLSLWKLLCEYQLQLTVKELTNVRMEVEPAEAGRERREGEGYHLLLQEQKQQLKMATFRSLIVSGREVGLRISSTKNFV